MRYPSFFFLFFLFEISAAQDVDQVRKNIEMLCSPRMHGRGYVDKGDKKAAKFVAGKYKKMGLKRAGGSLFQEFSFPVNTFPEEVFLKVDTTILQPGVDYLVHPASASVKGTFSPSWLSNAANKSIIEEFKQFTTGRLLILDITNKENKKSILEVLSQNPWSASAILLLTDEKLTWSVSQHQFPFAVIEVKKEKVSDKAQLIELNIESEFKANYKTKNVIGYIPGTENPNSFIVLSAHYDHLGRMGEDTYFPGANDNASGTAMLLDLAKYYIQNPPKYSVVFIAFAAEEAGLVGSEFYVNHPRFSLQKIKFLINLDLMGNGQEGITVVNGEIFPDEYEQLITINNEKNYLPEIKKRGKAANSDHYYFSENGVKTFFIYTMGGSKAYHDIYDTPDQLSLTHYYNVFHLLTDFVKTID